MHLDYYLPFWEDRIDPNYDYINDTFSSNRVRPYYKYDKYAHEILSDSPYEGILISLYIFKKKLYLENNNNTYTIKGERTFKSYLRTNDKIKIMGDCGAFGYVAEKEPPKDEFNTKRISELYEQLGFDYGVSIDHLVVKYFFMKDRQGNKIKYKLSEDEKKERVKLTLRNAKEFLQYHDKKDYKFIPIGVAQGYDLESYRNSVQALLEFGYTHIGIGSLVQYSSNFILDILNNIHIEQKGIKLHLFGVLRPNYLKSFEKLGVTSYDSASFLRKSWLRSDQNYLDKNNKWYGAIRIPISTNPRIDNNTKNITELKKMEKKALNSLILYGKHQKNIDKVLDTVISYDKLFIRDYEKIKLEEKYRKTLMDRPWEKCDCEICKNLGIQVIIFRGANRNKNRGFHNIWRFRHDNA